MAYQSFFRFLMLILLCFIVFISAVFNIPARQTSFLKKPKWLIPISLYLLYIICLTINTLITLETSSLATLLGLYIKIGFFILLLMFLPWRINGKIFKIYLKSITILSLLSIVLFLLIAFDLIKPLLTLPMPIGISGERVYDIHAFGVTDPYYAVHLGGLTLIRLQSFANEPGSFAVCLLPAIIWANINKQYFMLAVLSLALLFTFSVGGFIVLVYLGLLFAFRVSWKRLVRLLLVFAFMIYLIFQSASFKIFSGVYDYLETKYSSEGTAPTSGGARINAIKDTFEVLSVRPWGYGALQANEVTQRDIAVGWLPPIIEAGWLGGLAYFLAFFWLFLLASRSFLKENNKIKLLVYGAYISNFLFAFQRTQIDGSFFLIWFLGSLFILDNMEVEISGEKC